MAKDKFLYRRFYFIMFCIFFLINGIGTMTMNNYGYTHALITVSLSSIIAGSLCFWLMIHEA